MNADCIIVGGGPAGASLAIRLARLGAAVLLLDRQRFPRPKPCGDCLSPQANLLLEELGLLTPVAALHPARLSGWQIFAPDGTSFSARFDATTGDSRVRHAIAIERARFDSMLLDAASAAGARIETGAHVTGLLANNGVMNGVEIRDRSGTRRRVHARLVVGADGLRSTVRTRLDLDARAPRIRKLSLTWHIDEFDTSSDFGEMHLRTGGCIGVAPVADSAANLTVVADTKRYGAQVRADVRTFAEQFIAAAPALAGRIRPAQLQARPLASGPFDRPVSAITRPGVALVGDAAGYFDPFTGQGIYQALSGAALLAHAISNHGFSGGALAEYARAFRGAMRGTRFVQRLIDAALADPAHANRWIARLGSRPLVGSTLVAVTGDLLPPHALLSPRLLFSLLARNRAGRPT